MDDLQKEAVQFIEREIQAGTSKPKCRIMVLGIGGTGNKTVSTLIENGLTEADCIAINTDLRDLNSTKAIHKILIGETTRGLGIGGNPQIGRAATEESKLHLENLLKNADVVFIVASLGGGTGTSAAPIIADIARRKGTVVIGVVAAPLRTEKSRFEHEAQVLNEMRMTCDTVIVIDSNKIAELIPEIPSPEVFKLEAHVLANVITDIVETLSLPSLINLDFADFKTIVEHGGVAIVGVGESNASNRAEEAVHSALRNSLIDLDFTGARGALIQVSGDPRMTVEEVYRVGEIVSQVIGNGASVIWGARVNPQAVDSLKVTLVMTGVDSLYSLKGVGDILPKLYDIESSYRATEKFLPIDLGLDQMENFEE